MTLVDSGRAFSRDMVCHGNSAPAESAGGSPRSGQRVALRPRLHLCEGARPSSCREPSRTAAPAPCGHHSVRPAYPVCEHGRLFSAPWRVPWRAGFTRPGVKRHPLHRRACCCRDDCSRRAASFRPPVGDLEAAGFLTHLGWRCPVAPPRPNIATAMRAHFHLLA